MPTKRNETNSRWYRSISRTVNNDTTVPLDTRNQTPGSQNYSTILPSYDMLNEQCDQICTQLVQNISQQWYKILTVSFVICKITLGSNSYFLILTYSTCKFNFPRLIRIICFRLSFSILSSVVPFCSVCFLNLGKSFLQRSGTSPSTLAY